MASNNESRREVAVAADGSYYSAPPVYDSLYSLELIRGVKMTESQVRPLRNFLYRKYHPHFSGLNQTSASSVAWEADLNSADNPYSLTSGNYPRPATYWTEEKIREERPYSSSIGGMIQEMLDDEIEQFADLWPCHYQEEVKGVVTYFPMTAMDKRMGADRHYRSLIVMNDIAFEQKGNPDPFILIGIITAAFSHDIYESGNHYQKALSGVRAEEIDCRPQLRSFLSRYFKPDELDSIMAGYGTYVYDFLAF